MGLDQYLHRETYVKNWEHNTDENYVISVERKGGTKINHSKIKTIIEEVAYWRKANHIHNWFVHNVQNGLDDCGKYHVSVDQLQSLHKICEIVLQERNNQTSEELLSCVSGFFFGSTEYDEYYYNDVQYTYDKLSILLEEIVEAEGINEHPDIYYTSSW